jgi:hypothetical protein
VAASLIEGGASTATSIEDVLRGLAIGGAAIAAVLGLIASRLTPRALEASVSDTTRPRN